MKMMREKKAGKGKKIAQDKMLRQIKMAQIQKQKAEELEKARLLNAQKEAVEEEKKEDRFDVMLERTKLMEILIPKQAYSRPIYFKRHLINQQKINDFLGRNLIT